MEPGIVAGVGFDIDHTLAIDNKLERVAFLRLLELLLDRGAQPLGTIFQEADRIDNLLAEQRGGAFSIDDAVERFVREHGLENDREYADRYRHMAESMVEQFVVPLPGVRATMGGLRARGCRLAVLSNGWNPLQSLKAQRAGFDGPVIVSADIGKQKPSRGAFDVLLQALGTSAETTCFVGDDPHSDVAGAIRFGLKAIWLDDESKIYPADLPPPTARITELEELLRLIPSCLTVSP